ncbi:hypothetical protein PG993_010535 [Apiospora rasikravindrae]|uniref:Ankyrin n=1 Tax=Apiospora rasikravindrae TaxID=990691 RepID=A0ABR1SPC3_9PEZI
MIDTAAKKGCATTRKPGYPSAGCIADWNQFRVYRGTDEYIQFLKDLGNTRRNLTRRQRGYPVHHRFDTFCTPLQVAVFHGHLDTVRFLLDRGVNVNAVENRLGLLRLPYASLVSSGFGTMCPKWVSDIAVTPLVLAIDVGNYDIAKLLLQHGSAVELCKNGSCLPLEVTLLHLLATVTPSKEACEFMEMLVRRYHVPVDATDAGGLTPLARAAAMDGGDMVLETLMTLGADVNYVIPRRDGDRRKSILDVCFEADPTMHRGLAERLRAARRFIELSGEAGDKEHRRSLLLKQCVNELMRHGRPEPKVLLEFIKYLKART